MVDGSFDYMQLIKFAQCLGIRWICFQKDIPNPSFKKFSNMVSKYHVGADTILLSWV
jgi:hypothetical protein